MLVVPLYYYLGDNYINIWTAILFILFYSTVHNYNYGQLRVNDVHFLHHKEINTNIGPDICDIAFYTKNPKNKEVENTNHYIPNIIIITVLVLLMKYFVYNSKIKDKLINIFFMVMAIFALFISISSIYLYFTYAKEKKNDDQCEKTT
jgi:predicted membrane channel-forming protein YqfA (hemolysin III family)